MTQPNPVVAVSYPEHRGQTARDRDATSESNDRTADARDERSSARDERAEIRQVDAVAYDPEAVADRAAARRDRQSSANDRLAAQHDRTAAAVDRDLATREKAELTIDGLTGTRLRASGLAELERDIVRATRTSQPFVLAFIDVDDLKMLNDRQGHRAGDELLQKVVTSIREFVREYDLMVRYGGDEFLCGIMDLELADVVERFETHRATFEMSGAGSYSVAATGSPESTA